MRQELKRLIEKFELFQYQVTPFINGIPPKLSLVKDLNSAHETIEIFYLNIKSQFRQWITKFEKNMANPQDAEAFITVLRQFYEGELSYYRTVLNRYPDIDAADTFKRLIDCANSGDSLRIEIESTQKKRDQKDKLHEEFNLFSPDEKSLSRQFANELYQIVGEAVRWAEYVNGSRGAALKPLEFSSCMVLSKLSMRLGIYVPLSLRFDTDFASKVLSSAFLTVSVISVEVNTFGYQKMPVEPNSIPVHLDEDALEKAMRVAIKQSIPKEKQNKRSRVGISL